MIVVKSYDRELCVHARRLVLEVSTSLRQLGNYTWSEPLLYPTERIL